MSNKILAAFDGSKYSESASNYAIEIAKATNSLLIGVFIQDMRYLDFSYAYAYDQPFVDYTSIQVSEKGEREKIDLNIKLFRRACDERGVHFKVHLDKGVALVELLKESAFSDLIIIDSHTSFFTLGDKSPSPFLKDFLTDSHCPVLIVPHKYTPFDKIFLCYDGGPSSAYAAKMFSYIFPAFGKMKTTILTVNDKPSEHIKEAFNFKDLVRTHFGQADYEILHGKPEDELIKYLQTNAGSAIVVMGAYGRSSLSRLFHQSLSNKVIQEVNVPVFITHQ